jgi:hypothetical protein
MNPIVSVLDAVFVGRPVNPSICISSKSDNNFLVEDDNTIKRCVFTSPAGLSDDEIAQRYFRVLNPSSREIHLWAIDGCFMPPDGPVRCDCALFSVDEFCFVEFKTNATSSLASTIRENRRKACEQLENTIQLIKKAVAVEPLFSLVNFEAYLCSPPHYPSKDTSLFSKRIEFLETYGVLLFEKSEKQFL